MPHLPPAHSAVAWAGVGQARPQAPQWASAVDVSVSQPVFSSVSQSAKGLLQLLYPHTPCTHIGTALADGGQTFAHAPQWSTSSLRRTSQPSLTLPLQSA